jgi:polyisoprenyl-teichoic acid--peptidoglycan teichoic acid transferase
VLQQIADDTPAGPPGSAPFALRRQLACSATILGAALIVGYVALALLSRIAPALSPGASIQAAVQAAVPVAIPDINIPVVPLRAPAADSVFNRRINLLIVGTDKRPNAGQNAPANTDTIMVASIDPVAKRISLLSLPRDLWVDIHPATGGSYEDRLNASWEEGILNGNSIQAGANQLQKDLKLDFGIQTDYWVQLDFRGVEDLVDAVGGINIDVPEELAVPSWLYSDDDLNAVRVEFPPGRQYMDGYHAVAFARYRDTDNDLFRIQRQQLVVRAASAKALSTGLQNDPFGVWSAYSSLVKTNIPEGRLPGYALLFKEVSGAIQTYSLGDPVNGVPTVSDWTSPSGAQVLLWDAGNVQHWVNQALGQGDDVSSSKVAAVVKP